MKNLAGIVMVVLLLALVFMIYNDSRSSSPSAQTIEASATQTVEVGAKAIGLTVIFLIVASLVISVMSMFRKNYEQEILSTLSKRRQ